ncbi:MAG: hypothetical protein HYV55_01380 [Parcubacteria group bacterium]|nr:hypothetical protein [Parcubacteria group bacterium]
MFTVAKLKGFVKTYRSDIILGIGVFLVSLLSFGIGYMTAREQLKEPLRIEQQQP